MNRRILCCWIVVFLAVGKASADETSPIALVEKVVAAAGGEEHLLSVFRYRERVLITATPAAPVTADEPGNRTSVVQVGGEVWIGETKRNKDKVRVLCWAWSLRILLEPKSKLAVLPETKVNERSLLGLRVSESIQEPIDLYFDQETKRLAAMDYTDTRHVFSEWKTTSAGFHYPTHVAGYRFTDRSQGLVSEKQWYQTDVLELTPLAEVPANLPR